MIDRAESDWKRLTATVALVFAVIAAYRAWRS